MNEYMLIFRNEKPDDSQPPSAEQMKQVIKSWQDWIRDLAKKGNFSGTNRLLSEGKTLKQKRVVTDGPFLEGKEMVGGYVIVKASSLDEAVELAKECPNLTYGGSVEVRSVMHIEHDPASQQFLEEQNQN